MIDTWWNYHFAVINLWSAGKHKKNTRKHIDLISDPALSTSLD